MTNTDTAETAQTKPARDIYAGVRRFFYMMIILFFFWVIFGLAIPHLAFPPAPPEAKPENTMASAPVAPQAPAAESAPLPVAPAAQPDSALLERLEKAEARIAALEAAQTPAVDTSPLEAKVAMLQEQLDELQKKPDGNLAIQQLSQVSVFGQIRDAAARSEPFEAAHAQLVTLAAERPATLALLEQLKPFADKKNPDLATLKRRFEATRNDAQAKLTEGTLAGNIGSLVRIRKTGEPQGTDDDAVLARAQTKLSRGELDASIKELSQLSPAAAPLFAEWVAQAAESQRLQGLLDALQLELAKPSDAAPQ